MSMDRRSFVAGAFGAAFGGRSLMASAGTPEERRSIRAILFDGFALFDPRRAVVVAEQLYPEQSTRLVQAWRARQFEYQWLRALGGRYGNFLEVTENSLTFAARQVGITLTSENRSLLMAPYTNPEPWPDTRDELSKIRDLGVTLNILSNMTAGALESGLVKADLRPLFTHVLSTDHVRSFKPASNTYRLGLESVGLDKNRILFVAFAGWDVAGAVWFGFPTYWLNRLGSPLEELDASPIGEGRDLHSLFEFIKAWNS